MEAIKNYILSLAGFSFISSLVCALLPKIPAKRTVKFICGVILSLLIISPLTGMKPQFGDIFPETGSYNLYSTDKVNEITQSVISDKVSEVVGSTYEKYGISGAKAEVIFDGEGNILKVNINAVHEQAAKEAAAALGIPYEIIHQTG